MEKKRMKDFFAANSNVINFVMVTTLSICITIFSSGMILTQILMPSPKVLFESEEFAELLVNLVDSRFKLLAASFQQQIDELKLEVVTIDLSSHDDTHNYVSQKNGHTDHHEKIKKRQVLSSNVTRPGRFFCTTGSSPCSFYYADSPDSIQTRQQAGTKTSNKILPICESSSSLCNFYHPDHANVTVASRKNNTIRHLIYNETMISKNATMMSQDQTPIALEKSKIHKGMMPKNCTDLQLFGHKLNGFYLVAPNEGSKIETVYCDFQMSVSPDLKGFETRIGIVDVKSSLVQFFVDRNNGDYGSRNQKVHFDNLVLNVGGGFNWKDQYFQAPVAGTYVFSVTGSKCGHEGLPERASILMLHNGEKIAEVLTSDGTVFGGFSYQTTRKMNATDKIELVMQWGQIYLIYFTGWLLEQNIILP